jgi:hypothetical protein
MRNLNTLSQCTLAGLLACVFWGGCAHNHEGKTAERTFMPGPVIYGGVEYYPAEPGATYHNTPINYTTNRPPTGAYPFVTLVSTNGILIHLMESKHSTNAVSAPNLK